MPLSGRMPGAAGECVVHVMGHGSPVELGTQLTCRKRPEGVSGQVFTVGTVQDPSHFSSDSESKTVGDGQLDCILFVPEGTLTADYYTACYIKAENAGLYDNDSDEYQAAVDAVAEKLKAIQSVQCIARREELMETANDKLTEARAEYDSQKAEAERQFAEAEAKLADAQAQLDADALEAGEKELAAQKVSSAGHHAERCRQAGERRGAGAEFEEQLQQIELLVNLEKVADPADLRGSRPATQCWTKPSRRTRTILNCGMRWPRRKPLTTTSITSRRAISKEMDAGKRQMYQQGLISRRTSPTTSW